MTDNQKNILFDKFEVIECFKKDEYTGVYLARHIYLNKNIILKSLNTHTVPDNTISERFKREAKILAHLDHPNIIKVLDFGTYEKYFYISFEYLQGTSLREVIKENKLSFAQKREIIINILQGLNEAHNNGIIHRDIKPENIFVDKSFRIKIGDFGLALSNSESFVTSKTAIVGTPCYMSPEQVSGDKLSLQSDLFSLGIVIYELFTGNNPFLGNDVSESINNIISRNYRDLLIDLNKVPEDLREVLKKLLTKNIGERYKSAADVLKALGVETLIPANYATISITKVPDDNTKKFFLYAGSLIVFIVAVYFFVISPITNGSQQSNNNKPVEINTSVDSLDTVGDNVNENSPEEITSNNEQTEEPTLIANNISSDPGNQNQENNEENNNPVTTVPLVKKFGFINIECYPWAKIFIDSINHGDTPITEPIMLEEGSHELVLNNPDYPQYSTGIEISSNSTLSVRVNLDTLYGYLNCRVHPWGKLYINDNHVGDTPLITPLQLVPGNYTLLIKNPGFSDISESIVIKRNDTLSVQYSFTE